ncbi:hypothetical protein Sjap_005401 [Stephania japonica]|uniref:Cytochrome P450 n=1 Tax=Stephania japonica TaxID=461633 RepID=A0AAP0K3Y8_9MAGN
MDVKGQNHELLPFGSGRRSCPGVGLALQVMHLTLARILQAFELKTHPNVDVDLEECSGILLSMMHPLQIHRFHERESANSADEGSATNAICDDDPLCADLSPGITPA